MATFEATSEYIRNKFWDFLETFEENVEGEEPRLFYLAQLQSMRDEDKTTMYVDYEHLSTFDTELADLVQVILQKCDPALLIIRMTAQYILHGKYKTGRPKLEVQVKYDGQFKLIWATVTDAAFD
jgi:DNA replicative helicase MCM subunit Mcm2 (Cdc46/Mcm family)